MRCQAITRTKSIAAQTAARIAQRRHAIVVNKANGTFKHSNQRHGSCTKRSFGRCCHREKVKENINTAGSTDHAAIVHQSRIVSLAPPRINAALVDDRRVVCAPRSVNVFLYLFPVAASPKTAFCAAPMALVAVLERAVRFVDNNGVAALGRASGGLCCDALRTYGCLASRSTALVGHCGGH